MDKENSNFTVNKQALIEALLALERQETLKTFLLVQAIDQCIDQLKIMQQKLDVILMQSDSQKARSALINLFMTDWEWSKTLEESQWADWKIEFETKLNDEINQKNQAHRFI